MANSPSSAASRPPLVVLSALLFIALVAMVTAADPPPVKVNAPTIPAPTTFPPDKKPDDLKADHDADTVPRVGVTAGTFTVEAGAATAKITSLSGVTVSAQIQVRLPTTADATLKGHEQGHVDLYVEEYNRLAKTKVEDAFRDFVGLEIAVAGATQADRVADAEKKVTAEMEKRAARAQDGILDQMQTLSDKYDDLTEHGTSKTVNTADGKKAAKKELGLAMAPGLVPLVPDGAFAAVESGPGIIALDDDTFELSFAATSVALSSCDGADPLLGASVAMTPLQVIGVQENGTMRLGSGDLHITRGATTLLHGYLWEMAYLPSSKPGFGGMIQGFLDIPPSFTGEGIDNTIGSCFLENEEALFASDDLARRSTFWLFTDALMFDELGQAQAFSSVGHIEIGARVPEPAALALLGAALASVTVRRRRTPPESRQARRRKTS